ncbi:uncharacterized protein LOC108164944 isoform X2 [Drosophila miranda]|uniref:uncharacterized protein LOC108164944 isoform X2 n=1 Tax=Drosophila miranda TaxID=7229 RepID=UPI0007E65992|nr:uncharacterized protein LOC108164944 isoform X2 [Drosophila miranda]
MAGFLKTRKRSREDDLPCESMPLSKRINNLHLNYDDGNSSSSSSCSIPTQLNDYNNYNTVPVIAGGSAAAAAGAPAAAAVAGATNAVDILNGDGTTYGYRPELGPGQNPYYYDKNKMLYDLHVERVKRNTH